MRQNIRLVTCPKFESPVVYKFAEFPWQIPFLESETTAHSWIYGRGVGPRFLGHVTEADRVIGFLMEYVPGRTAEIQDLEKCQRALKQLHVLGFKHGDTNKHNFLISEGKEEAILIDFEAAVKCNDEAGLAEEMEGLPTQLRDQTGRGGVTKIEG